MDFVCVGKIVNTHGIKGEVRLLSDFLEKDLVFKAGFKVYIGDAKEELVIKSYRKHKQFDMLLFEGIDNINLVLKYKGKRVYINKRDLNLGEGEFILEDLIGMKVRCDDQYLGVVKDILVTKAGYLLQVTFAKNYYIPYNNNYIKQVDGQAKIVYGKNIKDLIL